jgi:hypothetical protein
MKLYRWEYEMIGGYGELILQEYYVYRETPKCYVIKGCLKDKFVLKEAKKKFAYETKAEALINYIKRTEYRIDRYLLPALRDAKIGLELAKNIQKKEDKCT